MGDSCREMGDRKKLVLDCQGRSSDHSDGAGDRDGDEAYHPLAGQKPTANGQLSPRQHFLCALERGRWPFVAAGWRIVNSIGELKILNSK